MTGSGTLRGVSDDRQFHGTGVRPFVLAPSRGHLAVLDQRLLPHEEVWLEIREVEALAEAIESLAVRGAPAIACVAALGLAVACEAFPATSGAFREVYVQAIARLRRTRPTAVNLFVALAELEDAVARCDAGATSAELRAAIWAAAEHHATRDYDNCLAIGRHGGPLMPDDGAVLTHCNAGALATAGYGTALGVIRGGWALGKRFHVLADETRPVLQGARLTAWELARDGIPVEVIADNMAGALMAQGVVRAVVVGADRIARNGDVANKIGTYTVAVLCHHHGIPFYVAAPWTTIDRSLPDGACIPIEQRSAEEVRCHGGRRMTPDGVGVRNPAFDVTPARLVTGIVTEHGVHAPADLADFVLPPQPAILRNAHSAP